MKRTLAALMSLAVTATTLAPGTAMADDHHYRGRYSYSRHHGNDAVAAGVIGLALGAVLGAAITDGNRRHRCDDRCAYERGYYDQGYYGHGGYYGNGGYYDNGYSDYGGGPSLCIVRERRWDPYSGRAVIIEEQRPC